MFPFFREKWEKANVTWLDGGNKVEFGQKKTYHFQPDLSTAGEDTKLILPNLPMLVRFSHFSKNKQIKTYSSYISKKRGNSEQELECSFRFY